MKKLIFIIVGGLLFFILLVGLVFAILTFMEKKDSKAEVKHLAATPTEENHSILGILLDEKQTVIDSLSNLLTKNLDSLERVSAISDSLKKVANIQSKQILKDSLTIVKLQKFQTDTKNKAKSAANQKQAATANLKELAKTYEQMKISEMKPIFAKLDDKTIIALYNSMSARKKSLVLKALSTDRAARITEKLAK